MRRTGPKADGCMDVTRGIAARLALCQPGILIAGRLGMPTTNARDFTQRGRGRGPSTARPVGFNGGGWTTALFAKRVKQQGDSLACVSPVLLVHNWRQRNQNIGSS